MYRLGTFFVFSEHFCSISCVAPLFCIAQKVYAKFGIASVINCRCFWYKDSRLIDYKSEAATSPYSVN